MKQFRPEFSGDKQAFPHLIPGNAIEHIRFQRFFRREQACEIDPAGHFASHRIDAHYAVGAPDIGVYLAAYIFQFIELGKRFPFQTDRDRCNPFSRGGSQSVEHGRAITHDQVFTIACKPPAFRGIFKLAQ